MSQEDLKRCLLQLLRDRKLTQTDLANATGISRKNINQIINDKVAEPRIGTLITISRHLHVHPMALMRELFKGWEFPNIQRSVSVGTRFIKSWEIQNIGNIAWTNRSLVCVDGEFEIIPKRQTVKPPNVKRGLIPSTRTVAVQETQPWETITLSVEFTAPSYPCTVISYWKMVDHDGNLCFPENEGLSCQVHVIGF